MTKGELFSVSAICPKCGVSKHMKVSDIPEYAYQCLECDEDFYSIECHDTNARQWEVSLNGQTAEWFKENISVLRNISAKYQVSFLGCDDADDEIYIDFGWGMAPDAETVQKLTDEVMELLLETEKVSA